MKRTGILLLLLPLLALVSLLGQTPNLKQAPPPGGSQVVSAFTGGSVWTSGTTGICITYFPVLGNLTLAQLFAPGTSGSPVVDKEHAYFIWVSEWNIQAMFQNPGYGSSTVSLAVVPAGKATIYYSQNPTSRDWSDVADRSTWGVPVATFMRGGGLFQSPDGFATDRFTYSAQVIDSKEVTLGVTHFNFREAIPHGMTCFEYGQASSTTETGACIAMSSN